MVKKYTVSPPRQVPPRHPRHRNKKIQACDICRRQFWHGFDWKNNKDRIKSNRLFWIPKIERNMQKDIRVNKALRDMDYVVFRFWMQDILKNLPTILNQIELFLETRKLWK